MPQEPQISGMSSRRRTVFFWGLVLIFLALLPTMIFYTTGYRFDIFNDETPNIVTTGGIYISTQSTDVDVYLDEEQIERPRLFRNAYYIQDIESGVRRVVVQGEGIQTWVKKIPVNSHIVTEAAAFNLPTVPRLRPVTEFQTSTGTAVYFASSTPATLFANATSTQAFMVATTSKTSDYIINPEHEFVVSLFGTSSATTTSIFAEFLLEMDRFRFMAPGEQAATTSTSTPTIIERNNIRLTTRELELYAVWQGKDQDVPYYFCVSSSSAASTTARYGEHVSDVVFPQLGTTTATSTLVMLDNRICRTEIKLDRLRQDVYLYDFFPGSSDLVLLHLQDGLYVTEIDDRAWQNTQLLYGGDDFRVIIENGLIYVEEGDVYFEIITEIESN
jgi:hypothetical protein